VEDVTETPNVSRDLALIKVEVNNDTRGQVTQLCDIFRAHIVDAGPNTVIVEVTGNEEKLNSLIELLRPIGILELVRTGVVTMSRGDHVLSPNGYQATVGQRTNGYRQSVL
jgi:acetolactate synthase-1/3 small subunit